MLGAVHEKRRMTLVEVIVAVALVALVVVSLFASVTQTSVFSKRIDRMYTASYLAQRRIDMLKRLDFELVQFAEETDVSVDADGNVTVKKANVNFDGSIYDDLGQLTFIGQPIVMETLFCDVE